MWTIDDGLAAARKRRLYEKSKEQNLDPEIQLERHASGKVVDRRSDFWIG